MTTIGAYEAKTHFSQLLERVARGERIIITRHNVPIAALEPISSPSAMSPEEAIAEIQTLRQRYRLGELSVKDLIEEGRA